MEIRTGGRNYGKQRELIDRMCKEIADLRSQNREQSARIRELEGLLDKTVNLLLKMPDEINDFELIEEAENALSTSETEAKYGEVGSQLELQFQPDD